MFFLSESLASENITSVSEQAPTFQSFTASLVPLIIFILIFYVLLIRPQQKKQKEHEKEVANLKPNDKVLTAGGIFGTIVKVKEKTLIVEIANDVEIEILSETVSLIKNSDTENNTEKEKKNSKK